MSEMERVISAINQYRNWKGKEPEMLVLDSFTHEKIRLECKEVPDDTIGTLKNLAGVKVVRLEDCVVI